MTNQEIAAALHEVGEHLERRGENVYKIQAYHRGARTVAEHGGSVEELYHAEGQEGLEALPNIGESLAEAIAELVTTGRLAQLDALRAEEENRAEPASGEEELPF